MNIIAAVDNNWGIGRGGDLLVSIPNDKKLFRDETVGKVIVMGRKTFENLPGRQALHGRDNIVLSQDMNFLPKGADVVGSLEEAFRLFRERAYDDKDIFIIGGESIYRLFLPYCDTAHITAIDYEYEADRHMDRLDKSDEWSMVLETEEETYFDLAYCFRLYKRRSGLKKY